MFSRNRFASDHIEICFEPWEIYFPPDISQEALIFPLALNVLTSGFPYLFPPYFSFPASTLNYLAQQKIMFSAKSIYDFICPASFPHSTYVTTDNNTNCCPYLWTVQ